MALPKRKIEMSEAFWTSLKRMKYDLEKKRSLKPTDEFQDGSRCDVLDYHMGREVWRTCRVLQHDAVKQAVFVHWEGWGHHWDEWIDLTLGRRVIAPLWSKVPRLSRTGKQIEFAAPLSIGIEGAGGTMIRLAPRGTPFYPAASALLSTCLDGQKSAHVKIYQGERVRARDNKLLGSFEIRNIPAVQGRPRIRLTVCLHPDGLLSVRAHCEGVGGNGSLEPDAPALAGLDLHDINPKDLEVEAALENEREHRLDDMVAQRSIPDPWEERKYRLQLVEKCLRKILGKDVTELIEIFDDELRQSLCSVQLEGDVMPPPLTLGMVADPAGVNAGHAGGMFPLLTLGTFVDAAGGAEDLDADDDEADEGREEMDVEDDDADADAIQDDFQEQSTPTALDTPPSLTGSSGPLPALDEASHEASSSSRNANSNEETPQMPHLTIAL